MNFNKFPEIPNNVYVLCIQFTSKLITGGSKGAKESK